MPFEISRPADREDVDEGEQVYQHDKEPDDDLPYPERRESKNDDCERIGKAVTPGF